MDAYPSQPFVFARHPSHDEGVDRAEFLLKLGGVEPPVVAHPPSKGGADPLGDIFQLKIITQMQSAIFAPPAASSWQPYR